MKNLILFSRFALYLAVPIVIGLALFIVKNPVGTPKQVVSTDIFAEAANLKQHVYTLADNTQFRNVENLARLNEVAAYIHDELRSYGIQPEVQTYTANGTEFKNIVFRLAADQKGPLLVVGAHYDVCFETPGADDNASGVSGLLEVARILKKHEKSLQRPVEIAFYTLEEPPYWASDDMGSMRHAKKLKNSDEEIELMISLEMIGRYTEEEIQKYPNPILHFLYPAKANYLAIIGRIDEFSVMRKVKQSILGVTSIPIETINSPNFIPGIGESDHSSFWHFGIPAIMITDTAYLRNFDYHTENDTADKLNYEEMAKAVTAIAALALKF